MKFYKKDGTLIDPEVGMKNYHLAGCRITAYELVVLPKEPVANLGAVAVAMGITPQKLGMALKAVTRMLYDHLVDEIKNRPYTGDSGPAAKERRELWASFGQGMYAGSMLDVYNNLRSTPTHDICVKKFPVVRNLIMARVADRIEY